MNAPTINLDAEPELLEEIVVRKDEAVEGVVRIYRELDFEYLRKKTWLDFEYLRKEEWQDIQERYQRKKIPIIAPAQIDLVLQRIIHKTPKEQINDRSTGIYITHLIQESYTAGNNNFTLNTKDTIINNLAYKLAGTTEQPIKLTINGNIGDKCGFDMEQLQLTINGNTEAWCGTHMTQSTITINGNTGNWRHENTTNSTIYTNNQETYKKIKANISKGNKIFLYDNKGNIIERYS